MRADANTPTPQKSGKNVLLHGLVVLLLANQAAPNRFVWQCSYISNLFLQGLLLLLLLLKTLLSIAAAAAAAGYEVNKLMWMRNKLYNVCLTCIHGQHVVAAADAP